MACIQEDDPVSTSIRENVSKINTGNDESKPSLKVTDPNDQEIQHGDIVAAHYNNIEEVGLTERLKSPILYLRNFNNWVKSVLIKEYLRKVQVKYNGKRIRVLDICCGKGGDIMKWEKGKVGHVVFADIADVSMQQCKKRYEDSRNRRFCNYTAEFLTLDCTKQTLRDKYCDPSMKFDLASCQFALHYSFESLAQARQMLSNVSDCIAPNGFFIGTLPDANEIILRGRKSAGSSFGNKVYNIKLHFDPNKDIPLFGAKYDVHLEGVVDCPEFLVNFNLLTKLASEYGLKLVYKERFADYFNKNLQSNKFILQRINGLESYPPHPDKGLNAAETEYEHVRDYLEREGSNNRDCVGTMSTGEWEVARLYLVFAFVKLKYTWDTNGKPVYEQSTSENHS